MPLEKPRPLLEHLSELRKRLLWIIGTFGAVFTLALFTPTFNRSFSTMTIQFLAKKFLPEDSQLIFLNPLEPLLASFKIALLISFCLCLPLVLYHLYAFLAPALDRRKKSFALWLGAGSVFFLALGAGFAYLFLIPVTMYIFMGYGAAMGAAARITLYEFCNFIFIMFLIFSVPFELPMVMGLLSFMGLVHTATWRSKRKVIYLGLSIFAAVITPDPTPVSMVLLTLCLWVLFETGIWFSVLLSASTSALGKARKKVSGRGRKSLYP